MAAADRHGACLLASLMMMTATVRFLLIGLGLAACLGEQPASEDGEGDFSDGKGDGQGAARVTSAYSDTGGASCTELSIGEEHADSQCKGVGDYSLMIHDRIWQGITAGLKLGESEEVELSVTESLPQVADAEGQLNFRQLGSKAEWRSTQSNLKEPYALGLRVIDALPQPNGTTKNQHHLAVFKLTGGQACLFALVEASAQAATANQLARVEMDKAQTEECPAVGSVRIITK